jgi:hypothetical protein
LTFIGTDYFNGWPIYVTDRDLSKHGVAVGTTGAGKTEYGLTIIESAIRAGHPVIYVDGKGDLKIAARIRAFAEKQQRKFYLFNADNVAQSDVYKERSVYPGPQAGHLLSMGRSGIQVLNLAQSFSDFRFASTDAETAVEQTVASTNTLVCFQLNSDVDAERAASWQVRSRRSSSRPRLS